MAVMITVTVINCPHCIMNLALLPIKSSILKLVFPLGRLERLDVTIGIYIDKRAAITPMNEWGLICQETLVVIESPPLFINLKNDVAWC